MSTLKNRGKIFDALLEMHGVGVVAAATGTTPVDLGLGAPQRGGVNAYPFTEGKLIIDITACSSYASYERYQLCFQGSHDSTFTTWNTLFSLTLGNFATYARYDGLVNEIMFSTVASWPTTSNLPVRFTLPFCNDYGGTVYRWLRIFTGMGTITTGINYYAFLSI